MKKIFAMLISLLFVASVFGVASTMAFEFDVCAVTSVSENTVRVGDIFTFTAQTDAIPTITGTGKIEIVSGPTHVTGIVYTTTYRAISPGKVTIKAGDISCLQDVTIFLRSLPMDKFMKIFGFGKKD